MRSSGWVVLAEAWGHGAIMIALLGRDTGKKLVDYPEESILIG